MNRVPDFFVDHATVRQRILDIKPSDYAATRNHLDGAVTHLSPFVTHGIISTATIANTVLENHSSTAAEKLLTELAWREYFHRFWQASGDEIFDDIRHAQERVNSERLPVAVANGRSGISVIDTAIDNLIKNGYMHNHARMWLASLTCNIGRTHWYQPSRWLYYHLLDGDLASNTLSWQWIAGTFSHRKYYANQENLNRFGGCEQRATFLDCSYEELATLPAVQQLQLRTELEFPNAFPPTTALPVHQSEHPVFLYSIWNLDPDWQQEREGTRILWIEPDMHHEHALSPLRWQFVKHWADSIDGLGIFVGDRDALFPAGTEHLSVHTREYPATTHWPGQRDERTWCYDPPTGPMRSFSNYWKKARKASEFFA